MPPCRNNRTQAWCGIASHRPPTAIRTGDSWVLDGLRRRSCHQHRHPAQDGLVAVAAEAAPERASRRKKSAFSLFDWLPPTAPVSTSGTTSGRGMAVPWTPGDASSTGQSLAGQMCRRAGRRIYGNPSTSALRLVGSPSPRFANVSPPLLETAIGYYGGKRVQLAGRISPAGIAHRADRGLPAPPAPNGRRLRSRPSWDAGAADMVDRRIEGGSCLFDPPELVRSAEADVEVCFGEAAGRIWTRGVHVDRTTRTRR